LAKGTFDGIVRLPASVISIIGGAIGLVGDGLDLINGTSKGPGGNHVEAGLGPNAADLHNADKTMQGWAARLIPDWSAQRTWDWVKGLWSSTPQPAPLAQKPTEEHAAEPATFREAAANLQVTGSLFQIQPAANQDATALSVGAGHQPKDYKTALAEPAKKAPEQNSAQGASAQSNTAALQTQPTPPA
jgi:hypothetical protein